jgi:poly(hydroxyalkanoate) granule-associated protein
MAKARKNAVTTTEPDIARKIWLAGVGAYGRVFAETQGALEKLAGSANETFDQLVANGEKVEDAVRARIAKSGPEVERVLANVSKQVKDLRANRRAALDSRIVQVRKTVSDTLAPFNVAALTKSVDKLSSEVDSLKSELARLKAKKPTKKKV